MKKIILFLLTLVTCAAVSGAAADDYVTTSPSRSARCETNKPPAMRVRIEGYTKKLQTRYNKGVQANCKAKGEKYGTKGT